VLVNDLAVQAVEDNTVQLRCVVGVEAREQAQPVVGHLDLIVGERVGHLVVECGTLHRPVTRCDHDLEGLVGLQVLRADVATQRNWRTLKLPGPLGQHLTASCGVTVGPSQLPPKSTPPGQRPSTLDLYLIARTRH